MQGSIKTLDFHEAWAHSVQLRIEFGTSMCDHDSVRFFHMCIPEPYKIKLFHAWSH